MCYFISQWNLIWSHDYQTWNLKSHFFFSNHNQFYCKRTLYICINSSIWITTQQIINIQKHASGEARKSTHSFFILATLHSWATPAYNTEVWEQSFLTVILSERWKEYYSKATVDSVCCWKAREILDSSFASYRREPNREDGDKWERSQLWAK